ncbi:MAG: single-stranded-DNA-specific exonuclease RecJ, partial [Arenicella sp.]
TDAAAELLAEAISAQASIMIVGDFDADGATSCAVAIKSLVAMGAEHVDYLVPNRFEFGYGLSPEIVGVAAMQQPDVIVTVDNGISSVAGVHAAQAMGMSVIVTDHHLPAEELPTADVIVNPNLPIDRFPSKNLAGVGVVFYVMLALRAHLRRMGWFEQADIPEPNMSQFLDLVALGTVADVVPLDRNNRILVQQGLQRIRAGLACPGLQALLTVGNRQAENITSSDLGFVVGPRLNAAGRLEDMSVGIECLLAEQEPRAFALATELDQLNKARREVEQDMRLEAIKLVDKLTVKTENKPAGYVLYDASWHQGVVGLVASKIKEQTNRPVVALAPADSEQVDGEWKGSLRSVEGVHIRDVLVRVDALHPGLISKFGGHAMAAGLSLPSANLGRFSKVFAAVLQEMTVDKDWSQVLWTDGELEASEYTLETAEQLAYHSPWGQGFPAPVFDGQFEVLDARVVGETHVKMRLRPRQLDDDIDAICFGYMRDHEALPQGIIEIVYRLDVNHYQGRKQLQLMVDHIHSN